MVKGVGRTRYASMIKTSRNHRSSRSRAAERRGAALMFCMFLIFMVALLVISVMDATMLDLASLRNSIDYERALYLANAGVHAVAAELEGDANWRGVITDGSYPADDTYTATAVDGAGGTVDVTARGVSGSITRTVVANFQL
jgi:Tfp pilus assembly protein PilX